MEISKVVVGIVNPLNLPEIVEQVMAYLKPPDLLNARLVNKQWNEEARKFIPKKINYTLNTNDNRWYFKSGYQQEFLNRMKVDSAEPLPEVDEEQLYFANSCSTSSPLFEQFTLMSFSALQSNMFVSIGSKIKKLTYAGHEIYQSRALRRILVHCPNLEYLNYTAWSEPFAHFFNVNFPAHNFLDLFKPITDDVKVLKLKTLIIKFTSYYSSLSQTYFDLLTILLSCTPNLEELSFPSFPSQAAFAPGVTNALLVQLPRLHKLEALTIGYQLENQEQIVRILNNKFKLKTLKLNENWINVLDAIAMYQPDIVSLKLSLRDFGLNDLQRMNEKLEEYEAKDIQLSLSKIHLLDLRNVYNGNQFKIKIMPLLSLVNNVEIDRRNGTNIPLVAIYNGIQSCATTSTLFRLNMQNYTLVEPTIFQTVGSINLRNIQAGYYTIVYLSQYTSLAYLEIMPTSPTVYRTIWASLTNLETLIVHLHPNIYPSFALESALTGIPIRKCSNFQRLNKFRYNEKMLLKKYDKQQLSFPCICQLTALRKFEIRYTGSERVCLTRITILSCFIKMKSITCLKFPYEDCPMPLALLQRLSPALHLETT